MKNRASLLSLLLIFALLLPCLVACGNQSADTPEDTTTAADTTATPTPVDLKLNDKAIENYTIIYSDVELDFNLRAAEYVKDEISAITGKELQIKLDTETEETELEILVGLTNRAASSDAAKVELGDLEFIASAKGTQIVLYGEEYMVAAAAYNFVQNNFVNRSSDAVSLSEDLTPKTPKFEAPENFILMIGDGMGFNSLKYGEELFIKGTYMMLESTCYPHYNVADRLPYKAASHTSPKGAEIITDSAAGGTALATGYKTYTGVVGMNTDFQPVKNLCELAQKKGMMTAVLTTDVRTGATPAAFSTHIHSRDEDYEIASMQDASGIDVILGYVEDPAAALRRTFSKFADAENGFFIMYEEAYIDKGAEDNDNKVFYNAYTKLNTALRAAMEFMMYNPDTLLILTADHESGGISWNEEKSAYEFTNTGHSGINVPFYALGEGASHIDGNTYENVYIAKLIAKLMGEENFGDPDIPDTTDATGLEVPSDEDLKAASDKEAADREALKTRLEEQEKAELAERESLRSELLAAD